MQLHRRFIRCDMQEKRRRHIPGAERHDNGYRRRHVPADLEIRQPAEPERTASEVKLAGSLDEALQVIHPRACQMTHEMVELD